MLVHPTLKMETNIQAKLISLSITVVSLATICSQEFEIKYILNV
jgi:hypothetical protein